MRKLLHPLWRDVRTLALALSERECCASRRASRVDGGHLLVFCVCSRARAVAFDAGVVPRRCEAADASV